MFIYTVAGTTPKPDIDSNSTAAQAPMHPARPSKRRRHNSPTTQTNTKYTIRRQQNKERLCTANEQEEITRRFAPLPRTQARKSVGQPNTALGVGQPNTTLHPVLTEKVGRAQRSNKQNSTQPCCPHLSPQTPSLYWARDRNRTLPCAFVHT